MGRSYRLIGIALAASVLAACGSSHNAPSLVPQSTGQTVVPAQQIDGVPAEALASSFAYVHLPLRNGAELDSLVQAQSDKNSPQYHHFLTPGQFRAAYAPSAADVATAVSALRAMGFRTYTTSQGVIASGSQAAIQSAFGVHYGANVQSLGAHNGGNSATPLAQGAAAVPQALQALGATVIVPRHRFAVDSRLASGKFADNRYSATGPYWFDDLKQAYGYPSYERLNGAGSTIGIVISSDVLDSDLAAYFGHEKLGAPSIVRRPVNGGAGFNPSSGDSAEASLDVQQSLGSAPGANLVLYSIPDLSDANVLLAYQAVVDDNRADVVSSSFGECELYYTAAYNGGTDFTYYLTQLYHDIFRQGVAQGITWVASSGDNGAYECSDANTGAPSIGVSSPADDPDVVAVGGTNLVTTSDPPKRNSAYVSENASSDIYDANYGSGYPPYLITWGSGGGISTIFSKPWYQYLVNTGSPTQRTLPDVAMHMGGCPLGAVSACAQANPPPRSSVVTAIGGQFYLLIGTSASSPEFAGLLAVTEQNLGTRLGAASGYIYALSALDSQDAFHANIPGDNGYYTTHRGYNYVLGNGTPQAGGFALYNGPLAGIPQSKSNP